MDYELLIQRVMEEVRKRLAEEEAKKAVCGKKEECTTAEERSKERFTGFRHLMPWMQRYVFMRI